MRNKEEAKKIEIRGNGELSGQAEEFIKGRK